MEAAGSQWYCVLADSNVWQCQRTGPAFTDYRLTPNNRILGSYGKSS